MLLRLVVWVFTRGKHADHPTAEYRVVNKLSVSNTDQYEGKRADVIEGLGFVHAFCPCIIFKRKVNYIPYQHHDHEE